MTRLSNADQKSKTMQSELSSQHLRITNDQLRMGLFTDETGRLYAQLRLTPVFTLTAFGLAAGPAATISATSDPEASYTDEADSGEMNYSGASVCVMKPSKVTKPWLLSTFPDDWAVGDDVAQGAQGNIFGISVDPEEGSEQLSTKSIVAQD